MTGVIDQDVDRNAFLAEAPMQLDDRRNIREIDLLHTTMSMRYCRRSASAST
jgi:hypothetical protein